MGCSRGMRCGRSVFGGRPRSRGGSDTFRSFHDPATQITYTVLSTRPPAPGRSSNTSTSSWQPRAAKGSWTGLRQDRPGAVQGGAGSRRRRARLRKGPTRGQSVRREGLLCRHAHGRPVPHGCGAAADARMATCPARLRRSPRRSVGRARYLTAASPVRWATSAARRRGTAQTHSGRRAARGRPRPSVSVTGPIVPKRWRCGVLARPWRTADGRPFSG